RMARLKATDQQPAVYHCISRVVGGQFLLDDLAKEKLAQLLLKLSRFCGIEVITYCFLSNHFHLLLRVPPPLARQDISDTELLQRLESFYGKKGVLTVLAREGFEKRAAIDADLRQSLLERMGEVSAFMKEFKQRFSRWYNRQHARFGTLWAERFKSLLVEDAPGVVRTLAAYIDLNPVRAGLVSDPKEYRFCGYTAALSGNKMLRAGLMSCLKPESWGEAAAEYRMSLFVTAGSSGASDKVTLDRETILAELKRGGELSVGQILRVRVRHLTDGVVLGSKEFVNEMFVRHREKFGAKRKDGARRIRGVPLPGLSVLRDLQVRAVG
ncbi:MAG: transposase, partial [Verrucomicrobiae bacterium]|nr:transposase [Verrucomicrobiae bacterium]